MRREHGWECVRKGGGAAGTETERGGVCKRKEIVKRGRGSTKEESEGKWEEEGIGRRERRGRGRKGKGDGEIKGQYMEGTTMKRGARNGWRIGREVEEGRGRERGW